ncbi:hypothetical protein COB11_03935 [Candidatus Aerophobetes bacterium]|uniref:NYN domain-containing protein n=1 Tax=Aerophobetes bacterium TaxID=2030807 RepID=A0A2A4YJ60_UNCAE|nr:MAG: hypothetical protein COB11_03935 [Candidatus Aerophobetes bacterium]
MHYYIDGYNLLFRIFEDINPLREKRETVIETLQTTLSDVKLKLSIVFDSRFELSEDFPTRLSRGSLEIIYSPKGLCADKYIIELLSFVKHPKATTVVTSDNHLALEVKALGAKTKSIDEFLEYLSRKRDAKFQRDEKTTSETPYDFERLLNAFEKKLRDDD